MLTIKITEDYYDYLVRDYKCKECGSTEDPDVAHTYEFSDRDGNRGIWVRTFKCANCGAEESVMLHY